MRLMKRENSGHARFFGAAAARPPRRANRPFVLYSKMTLDNASGMSILTHP